MSGIGIFGAGIFSAGIFNNGVLGAPGGAGTPIAIKYNPGCQGCCEVSCMWAEAHFTSDSDLSKDWIPDNISDWTITDSRARTSVTSSILLHKTLYSFNGDSTRDAGERGMVNPYHQHSIKAEFSAVNERTFVFIVAAADENNYIALEVELKVVSNSSIGSFNLIEVVNGVKSQLTDTYYAKRLTPDATIYARVDFDNGEVRALVSLNGSTEEYPSIGSTIRSNSDVVTYHGDMVGIGVTSGSGEASFGLFEAGCSGVKEFCIVDDLNDYTQNGTYYDSDWELMSGTAPSLDVFGRLSVTSSVVMRKINSVQVRFDGNHSVTTNNKLFPSGSPDGGTIGIYIGCDIAFENGWLCTMTTPEYGQTDFLYEIFRIKDSVMEKTRSYYSKPDYYDLIQTAWIIDDPDEDRKVITFAGLSDVVDVVDGGNSGYSCSPNPGTTCTINEFKLERDGEINVHWPGMTYVCSKNKPIDCILCDNVHDWPTWAVVVISGFTDNDCISDAGNGSYYVESTKDSPVDQCNMDISEQYSQTCYVDYDPAIIQRRLVEAKLYTDSDDAYKVYLHVILELSGGGNRFTYEFKLLVGSNPPGGPVDLPDCNWDDADIPYVGSWMEVNPIAPWPLDFVPLGTEGIICKFTLLV